ncbi:MAG: YceI family protein [Cytophagia bacterium]|jgi:polyisoprenoid-binding protein YceI|nr:MAG: YceI family protein [Cytophagales bacterium]TAG36622.1 MAG: YceI family protein [Cytophagia bacterium]TAG57640.1 MAG: YceI family protein [Runella slithyformis]TAG78203.1 MAG: YceI family protein [Cytophagales bacterium]
MKTMKYYAIALVAALSLNVATATEKTNKKANKVVSYKVDVAKSNVKWHAKKVTGEHMGSVNISDGALMVDGTKITGGSFNMDMNSIVCTDITDATMNGKLIGHLKSDDFFSVAKNPKAAFKITKVEGNNVTGNMTIKGITNSITFPVVMKMEGKNVVATAKMMLDRTKWDIRYNSKKFFESIGDKAIYDDFEIDLTLTAAK